MNKRETGGRYEKAAADYLSRQGYEIIRANYRCSQGEVELICRQGGYLVFVEVKYRFGLSMGTPEEAVNWRKQERIRKVAAFYMYTFKLPEDTPCRFDVVSILGEDIKVIQNAF